MRNLPISESQWLFPIEALQTTPSRDHGVSYEEEIKRRAETIKHVQSLAMRVWALTEGEAALMAKGHARGVGVLAAALIHRFYMRRSIVDFPPELMAPTMLFIASKVEEEPLRLRLIVNKCLEKFDNDPSKAWDPPTDGRPAPIPSNEYRRWENDILAAEEVAQETLCFDMNVQHPWEILHRAMNTVEHAPKYLSDKGLMSNVHEFAEHVLKAIAYYPTAILHRPAIVAFAAFIICLASISPGIKTLGPDSPPTDEAYALAAELGSQFDVDIRHDVQKGAVGDDLAEVQACIQELQDFADIDWRGKGHKALKEMLAPLLPANEPNESRTYPPQLVQNAQTGKKRVLTGDTGTGDGKRAKPRIESAGNPVDSSTSLADAQDVAGPDNTAVHAEPATDTSTGAPDSRALAQGNGTGAVASGNESPPAQGAPTPP